MFTEYINAAMETAQFEYWDDDKVFYGHIPACRGVLATGDTLDLCLKNWKRR